MNKLYTRLLHEEIKAIPGRLKDAALLEGLDEEVIAFCRDYSNNATGGGLHPDFLHMFMDMYLRDHNPDAVATIGEHLGDVVKRVVSEAYFTHRRR